MFKRSTTKKIRTRTLFCTTTTNTTTTATVLPVTNVVVGSHHLEALLYPATMQKHLQKITFIGTSWTMATL